MMALHCLPCPACFFLLPFLQTPMATPAAAALAQLGSLYINKETGQIMQK
jgi:hypothetical protein